VRTFGLLSTLVIARQVDTDYKANSKRLRKLEAKLLNVRNVSAAKEILMRTQAVNETQAYELIRREAMAKRTTTEEIASLIVRASEILGTATERSD